MWNRNFNGFLGCEASWEEADVVLFGAPFDSTSSYRPGSRSGPRAMREESFGIETYSPYRDADLTGCAVFDGGDPELCFGDPEPALEEIGRLSAAVLDAGKLPVMLGGEHLVTLGAVREAAKRHSDLRILHFDAHADLREDYLGARLSHATVLRRCWELTGDGRIYQFGVRSGTREEFAWAKDHVFTRKFDFEGLERTVAELSGLPVYFTVDLDVLDPSVFPGTGTPEPGGVSFLELMGAMAAVADGCGLVGCDLVELSPGLDGSGASTMAACKLLRELLLGVSARRRRNANDRRK